jgi:hypothetical protein
VAQGFIGIFILFFVDFRVSRRSDWRRTKSSSYKLLPIAPRDTDDTRRFVFCSQTAFPQGGRKEKPAGVNRVGLLQQKAATEVGCGDGSLCA